MVSRHQLINAAGDGCCAETSFPALGGRSHGHNADVQMTWYFMLVYVYEKALYKTKCKDKNEFNKTQGVDNPMSDVPAPII